MKKRLLSLAIALVLVCSLLPLQGLAATEYYVFDTADLLTNEEWYALDQRANALSAAHNMGFYIVTLTDYADYGDTLAEAMDYIVTNNAFGYGDNSDALVLFLATEEGVFCVYRAGAAFDLYTETVADALGERFITDMEDGKVAAAFERYLDNVTGIAEGTLTVEEPVETFAYVLDDAGILSREERAALEQKAAAITAEYDCGVYIVTVDDFWDYGSEPRTAAQAVFERNNFGTGENHSGMLLFMSMDDRDYYLLAHGYGSTAFTAYGTTLLEDAFLDNFRKNDWYGGFADYLLECETLLYSAAKGDIVASDDPIYQEGYYTEPEGINWSVVLMAALIGLVVAGIFTGVNYGKLKTAKKALGASEYTSPHALNVTRALDLYTHTTTTRRRIETSSSSGGGRSSGGGGYSGRGGKF